MSRMTYEYETRETPLEKFEWDSTWIEQTDNKDASRIYYIGDSISVGLRNILTEKSNGKYVFDGYGTSKAPDNPYYLDTILLFSKQLPKTDIILFNTGLHGWHLDDEKEYPVFYEKTVQFLLKEFPESKLILLLTTYLADEERRNRVKERNRQAVKIAEKYGIPYIDLYEESVKIKDFQHDDGCHFKIDGLKIMAENMLNEIEKVLVENK